MAEQREVKATYLPLFIISGVAFMALAAAFYLAFFAAAAPTADASARSARDDANRAAAAAGLDPKQRSAMEAIVRDYILQNPEIITDAVTILRQRDTLRKLESVKAEVTAPFPGAVLGNPDGDVTLIEFSDYACGYCRASLNDVRKLISEDKGLRIVVRELPILSEESGEAARWALAAAKQGKYAAFHDAMYAAGRPGKISIDAAARKAGLDIDAARSFAAGDAAKAEVARNIQFAQTLGFGGTPSWIVGDQLLEGAVGYDALKKAIAAARAKN